MTIPFEFFFCYVSLSRFDCSWELEALRLACGESGVTDRLLSPGRVEKRRHVGWTCKVSVYEVGSDVLDRAVDAYLRNLPNLRHCHTTDETLRHEPANDCNDCILFSSLLQ